MSKRNYKEVVKEIMEYCATLDAENLSSSQWQKLDLLVTEYKESKRMAKKESPEDIKRKIEEIRGKHIPKTLLSLCGARDSADIFLSWETEDGCEKMRLRPEADEAEKLGEAIISALEQCRDIIATTQTEKHLLPSRELAVDTVSDKIAELAVAFGEYEEQLERKVSEKNTQK